MHGEATRRDDQQLGIDDKRQRATREETNTQSQKHKVTGNRQMRHKKTSLLHARHFTIPFSRRTVVVGFGFVRVSVGRFGTENRDVRLVEEINARAEKTEPRTKSQEEREEKTQSREGQESRKQSRAEKSREKTELKRRRKTEVTMREEG